MNIGDLVESAIWITGEETGEDRVRYENDVCDAIEYLCLENGFINGQVTFTEKHPMDNVIEVPDHIQGERVRLLVGESEVTGKIVESPKGSFVANLELKDLKKLRHIIRASAIKNKRPQPNNMECDSIIEEIGPDVVMDQLLH